MWHEARKQEKKLREAMVNYQKRAERRREHYDKLRGDPHQLLRVNGNKCKLHLDPKAASTLDSTMIPWQGDPSHIISQYDVRIHLDYIPDYSKLPEHKLTKEEKSEDARCNYERYRVLIQNAFHGLSEADALAKISVEEMYPEPTKKITKKSKTSAKSAIGYSYDDNGDSKGGGRGYVARQTEDDDTEEKGFSGESDYEIDMDVDSFNTFEVDKVNVIALDYDMPAGAFSKSLRAEKSELLEQKMLRLAELEKTAISGKMSRRERRTWKESQQQIGLQLDNVPSYTVRGSPTYDPYEQDGKQSRSRSTSPEFEGTMEYITVFGGNDDQGAAPAAATSADTRTTAATMEPPAESHSGSDRTHKRLSHAEKHSRVGKHGGSYDDSPRRRRKNQKKRWSSSDREGHRSGRGRHRREDRYSPDRRRSPRDRRSARHRDSSLYSRSRSRDRDRYSRRHRGDSYSRSRSRSRGRGKYRRSRERNRYDDRRHRHYSSSSSSSSSSRFSSRDSRKARYHTKRKQSRSSSSGHSRSSSMNRNELKRKLDTRSKSRSMTPRLPSVLQSDVNIVRDLSPPPLPPLIMSPPTVPSPPPPRSPVPQPGQDSNDESAAPKPAKSVTKASEKEKPSRRDRLMKKMQAQLNKQHKMDKKAVKVKEKKKRAERMEREDLLRDQQRKLKETQREELKEELYTYSGQAETYKLEAAEQSDSSSSADSPTRLLMMGGRAKNDKGTSKDNDFYYGRFS